MKKLIIIITFLFLQQFALAQCLPDRHSTSWYDGWASCSASASPNPARGVSHWIMYNFGKPYSLSTTTLWNSNDPAHLDYGIQGYAVDYSLDGTNWTTLGTFAAEKASGSPFYEGIEGPDFDEAIAQFVLITALSNYGGNCFGFSELRINLGTSTNGIDTEKITDAFVYPNPFTHRLNIKFFTGSHDQTALLNIYDLTGRLLFTKSVSDITEQGEISIENSEMKLVPGMYSIEIISGSMRKINKIIKI